MLPPPELTDAYLDDQRAAKADITQRASGWLGERIEAMRSAGYTQFTIQLVPGHEHALAEWARIRKAFA